MQYTDMYPIEREPTYLAQLIQIEPESIGERFMEVLLQEDMFLVG